MKARRRAPTGAISSKPEAQAREHSSKPEAQAREHSSKPEAQAREHSSKPEAQAREHSSKPEAQAREHSSKPEAQARENSPKPKAPARGAFSWQEIHERLARARAATEEALHLSPERARAIMQERAHILARVPPQAPRAADVLEVAIFTLANERYAIETHHIREVARFREFTPVPGAPDFLVGLLNLRGEILAVFDLRKFFGVADPGLTDLSRVLVLGGERPEFGVLADTVHEIRTLRIDDVFEPPGSVAGIGREYPRGVTADGIIVLDGALLLQTTRLFLDQGDD